MKNILLLIGGLIIAMAAYYYFHSLKKSPKPIVYSQDGQDYYISTESQSDDRLKKLGMDQPSENASNLLDINKLSFPKEKKDNVKRNYAPNDELEYVIEIEHADGSPLDSGYLSQLFDLGWRQNYSSTIYGYSIKDDNWTFAFSSESPASFDKIKVGVKLLDVFDRDKSFDKNKLLRYYNELLKRTVDKKIKVSLPENVSKAIERAKNLTLIHNAFDKEANIVLRSNSTFDGLKAWDAMLCVGLKWGDGDLFHWNNKSGYGSDDFFAVTTSTEPTYFLPEEVKDGKMNPENLVFGFSIPRNADPVGVYKSMIGAVKYCQKKLGGEILNQSGQPFNEDVELKRIASIVDAMKKKGIRPGSDDALQMF
jgi:cell division protein ZipA